jgi:hypothetical protein
MIVILVREVMTMPVVTVSPNATVKQAIRLLYERNITAVPVVNGHEATSPPSTSPPTSSLVPSQESSVSYTSPDVSRAGARGPARGPDRGPTRAPKGLWSFGGRACGPVAGARRVPMLDDMPVFRGAEVRGDALAAARPAGW